MHLICGGKWPPALCVQHLPLVCRATQSSGCEPRANSDWSGVAVVTADETRALDDLQAANDHNPRTNPVGAILQQATRTTRDNERPPPPPHLRI